MTTHARVEPASGDVTPGDELTFQLVLANNGSIVESYEFEILGDVAPWTAVDPPRVNLFPGDQATVDMVIRPPRTGPPSPGTIPFAVRVVPVEHPEDPAVVEGDVTILPFTTTTAEITPRTSSGMVRARHDTAVDNRGNVPITVGVAGTDQDGLLRVQARPSTLTVGPGEAAFTKVTVRHRHPLWRGAPVTRPFQVVLASEDGPPIMLDAATLQTPIIPKPVPRILAALVALAVLMLAAWFWAFKPAMESAAKAAAESAAREAVDEPLAKVASQADNADKKANNADKQAKEAKQIATSKAPVAATQGATPARIRLQTAVASGGGSDTASYTVAEGTTLAITDLVLQNPQGDSGRVDVLVEDNPIMTLALANFRDIDYHFVSPIEVPGQKSFSIRTVCQKAGSNLVGTTGAAQCRIWALANGVNRTKASKPAASG